MPGAEEIDLVDENDSVVGSSTIERALRGGLLHRAVAVLVIRSTGKYLLQQRSKKDLWQPGLWTISSTGHVGRGETYAAAAKRELLEELGLEAELSPVKKYLLPLLQSGGLTEREWVTLYVGRTDAPCEIDPIEIEGVREVDEPSLRRMLDGEALTPDAVVLLSDFLGEQAKARGVPSFNSD